MVIMQRFMVLLRVRKVEENMAGTINNIVKGFVIPPVKYNNNNNCNIS